MNSKLHHVNSHFDWGVIVEHHLLSPNFHNADDLAPVVFLYDLIASIELDHAAQIQIGIGIHKRLSISESDFVFVHVKSPLPSPVRQEPGQNDQKQYDDEHGQQRHGATLLLR
jgi:hypothetical protein